MQINSNNQKINTKFDLEERTLEFSKKIIGFCKKLPRSEANNILIPQLIRSSTSIGANYREANDSLGKKDFLMRTKICRKEAKETHYWLELVSYNNPELREETKELLSESLEYLKIFSAIITKFL